MSSDLGPISTNSSSASVANTLPASAALPAKSVPANVVPATVMSSASPLTSERVAQVPLPARLKATSTGAAHPHHDLTLPIITLSNRGCFDPRSPGACGFRMDDAEGPRCLSLPLSRVQQERQTKPAASPPRNDPPPPAPYPNWSSSSLDNLSLCVVAGGATGGGHGGRLVKASSDNPVYGLSASPPVPPRDYIPRATSRPTVLLDHRQQQQQQQMKPEIHPIVQDGQKRSNTHYWLLPDKQKTSTSLDDVDKMTSDERQEHYVNLAGNGLWARKFGISKASSFGGHKKTGAATSSAGNARKEDSRRSHRSSEGTDAGHRSVFYTDTVPLLSDVSSIDSMSVNIPPDETTEDVRRCPSPTTAEDDGCTTSMGEVKEMIDVVQSKIDGVTSDESFTALVTHQWNVQAAVEYLKVENLFRLGLASRERCRRKLEINNWDLQRAASDLLDLIGLDMSCK